MGSGKTSATIQTEPQACTILQAEAQQAAREMLQPQGGGEMTTKGRDGQFRAKDTIKPGNDPRDVKG
jgi:hypothetical protein